MPWVDVTNDTYWRGVQFAWNESQSIWEKDPDTFDFIDDYLFIAQDPLAGIKWSKIRITISDTGIGTDDDLYFAVKLTSDSDPADNDLVPQQYVLSPGTATPVVIEEDLDWSGISVDSFYTESDNQGDYGATRIAFLPNDDGAENYYTLDISKIELFQPEVADPFWAEYEGTKEIIL